MFVRINSDDEDDNEDRLADSKAEFVEDEPILLALLDINDILTPEANILIEDNETKIN